MLLVPTHCHDGWVVADTHHSGTMGIVYINLLANIYWTCLTSLGKCLSAFGRKRHFCERKGKAFDWMKQKIVHNPNYGSLCKSMTMSCSLQICSQVKQSHSEASLGVEPPMPLLFANWAHEQFRVMIPHARMHLPRNNYKSQQGTENTPKIASTHTCKTVR